MRANIEKNISWTESIGDPAVDMRLGEYAIQKLRVCPYWPPKKHLWNRPPGSREAVLEKPMQPRSMILQQ